MLDKRNYRRFSFESRIFLKIENDPKINIEGKLLDFCFVGRSIFLKNDANLDVLVGSIVKLDIPDLLGQPLVGKGKVISVKKHRLYAQDGMRVGLEFLEMDKEMIINVLNLLESKILEQIRRNKNPHKNSGFF